MVSFCRNSGYGIEGHEWGFSKLAVNVAEKKIEAHGKRRELMT